MGKKDGLVCVFCKNQEDSVKHLFFECELPKKLWIFAKSRADIGNCPNNWDYVLYFFVNNVKGKSLILAYTVYFIWRERNGILFSNRRSEFGSISKEIEDYIKLKLLGMKRHKLVSNLELCSKWGIVINGRRGIQL